MIPRSTSRDQDRQSYSGVSQWGFASDRRGGGRVGGWRRVRVGPGWRVEL